MSKKSFFKYIMQKINENFTIVTKILLIIFILSSFIPLQTGQVDNLNTFQTFLSFYTVFITMIDGILMFALIMLFIDFDINENNDDNILFKLYIFMVLTPIASISTYVLFGVLTPIQVDICLPTIVSIVIYVLESMSKVNIDTTKFEKIFFKK